MLRELFRRFELLGYDTVFATRSTKRDAQVAQGFQGSGNSLRTPYEELDH